MHKVVTSTESMYTLTEETLTPVMSSKEAPIVGVRVLVIEPAVGVVPVSRGGRKSMNMFVLIR